jgi:hypothetical protein
LVVNDRLFLFLHSHSLTLVMYLLKFCFSQWTQPETLTSLSQKWNLKAHYLFPFFMYTAHVIKMIMINWAYHWNHTSELNTGGLNVCGSSYILWCKSWFNKVHNVLDMWSTDNKHLHILCALRCSFNHIPLDNK